MLPLPCLMLPPILSLPGDPRRAVCPEPGCGTALPSASVARLLPAAALDRFQLLVVQRYATVHLQELRSCPQAGCGVMLHLPGPSCAAGSQPGTASGATAGAEPTAEKAAAGATTAAGQMAIEAAAVAAAAPGAGLDAECGACGHLLCWRCGGEAHEPASCAQVRIGTCIAHEFLCRALFVLLLGARPPTVCLSGLLAGSGPNAAWRACTVCPCALCPAVTASYGSTCLCVQMRRWGDELAELPM